MVSYKVKLSLPVTNDELLTIKNAALALDDGDEEPGVLVVPNGLQNC